MAILDTNFLIALQAGEESALRLLEELSGEPLLVPAIVAVEFLTPYGTHAGKAYEELDKAFTLVHTSGEWIQAAAGLRLTLRSGRKSIRLADFWIATWGILHDMAVVTRNRQDFETLGVRTRAW